MGSVINGVLQYRVKVDFTGQESMTKQSHKDECDINKIMAGYERTGVIAHLARYEGQYGDVAEGIDYQEALNRVIKAREMFGSLPASIRARFENDPGKYFQFVMDPGNVEEMVKLGLADLVQPATAPAPAPLAGAGDGDGDNAPKS